MRIFPLGKHIIFFAPRLMSFLSPMRITGVVSPKKPLSTSYFGKRSRISLASLLNVSSTPSSRLPWPQIIMAVVSIILLGPLPPSVCKSEGFRNCSLLKRTGHRLRPFSSLVIIEGCSR